MITFKQFLEGKLKDLESEARKYGDLWYIDLDLANSDNSSISVAQHDADIIANDCGVKAKVIELVGPGGGNPLVHFVGKDYRLLDMVERHWGEDKEFFDEFAKPVTSDKQLIK